MVRGTCIKLEQMILQGKVRRNTEGKIVLPSGTMIPNYFSKQLYMERIEEWHWLNPGQIVTGRLSSNANPDPEQVAMQQSLIHEATPMATPLTSDTSVTSPAAKPADIGKAPEHTVAKEQSPVAKEPVAQPPIHPFSGIPSRYAPPR
ncbi:hypothetical protein C0989_005576 [Termitomyces sp. Mn162]|nr:hypothetical protein C0989_005576 [Termitomyces sp. Mn162]